MTREAKLELVKKHLKESKVLWADVTDPAWKRYEFEVGTNDLPDKKIQHRLFFCVTHDEVTMSKRTSVQQKFPCVGGPLDGKRSTEKDAEGYVVFNRGSRWKLAGEVPKAVLVFAKDTLR